MRAWELTEANPYRLSSHYKLWVNPEQKKSIEVPIDKHHTQFAYEHPEKFGLSGKLFKDYDYPVYSNGKPDVYDKNVAVVMYNAGWVRTNIDKEEADVHCMDLRQCANALRFLRQRYNDFDRAIIEIGADINGDMHYFLQNDEHGNGSLRTFMRTGKIVEQ